MFGVYINSMTNTLILIEAKKLGRDTIVLKISKFTDENYMHDIDFGCQCLPNFFSIIFWLISLEKYIWFSDTYWPVLQLLEITIE